MRMFGRRLDKLEERKAFEAFLESKAEFDGRSKDEMQFFVLHGGGRKAWLTSFPPNREYVVYGIRTTIVNEWADKRMVHSNQRDLAEATAVEQSQTCSTGAQCRDLRLPGGRL